MKILEHVSLKEVEFLIGDSNESLEVVTGSLIDNYFFYCEKVGYWCLAKEICRYTQYSDYTLYCGNHEEDYDELLQMWEKMVEEEEEYEERAEAEYQEWLAKISAKKGV